MQMQDVIWVDFKITISNKKFHQVQTFYPMPTVDTASLTHL